MMAALREAIAEQNMRYGAYQELTEEEPHHMRDGDWVVEFLLTPTYIARMGYRDETKYTWSAIRESWWAPAKDREMYRVIEMFPRHLDDLVASRVPRVFREAISCGDVAVWRFRNTRTNEVIPGDIL